MLGLFRKRMPAERMAGAYLHPAGWIIHALHRAVSGVLLSATPVMRLQPDASDEELGRALRAALDGYRERVPHPTDWKTSGAPFLRATGFRSWKALQSPAKSCWIRETAQRIEFTPLRNGGSRGDAKGFQPFGAEIVNVPAAASDCESGAALRLALARSVIAIPP